MRKIYELTRRDAVRAGEVRSQVVVAESHDAARQSAVVNRGPESALTWVNPELSTCRLIADHYKGAEPKTRIWLAREFAR